ncbi:MAG: L,D-transpeptidase family protein, partial [Pseudomonadota bacterium]|nr:L,D-transpeptidase family protein [Pseudomonadota bacterium]
LMAERLGDAAAALHPRLPRKEREAMAAFYALGNYQPLWVKDGAWTPAANRLIARLKSAAEDGLETLDYPIPAVASTKGEPVEDWAEAEIRLSAASVLYARDARGGRIEPSRLSSLMTPRLDLPAGDEVLRALSGTANAGAVLARFHPQHAGYQALKAKLAEVRQSRPASPMVRVPLGPALRVGMRDPRVPLIRARFGLGPAGDDTSYDERVASAVAAFQRERGLPASGVLTPKTVAALSGPSPAQLEADLIANMERWRWLPADLGERHIFVNIPEYRLRLFERGQAVHQTRVVVGKAESPTPVFSDQMEHVIVNPSWTVPPSILKKEFLPALARDPSYAARRGYEVIRRNGQITVRQPPGEQNALGYVKFIFPNDHAVYLHDTPSRRLFSAERRAFSHGCVRVDQPFRLAEEVLRRQGSWSEEKLKSLVGKGERYIRLQDRLPVHLAYFTLAVDEHGELKRFEDIYGHHAKVRAALGLDG